MPTAIDCYKVFQRSIEDYHQFDDINRISTSPYPAGKFESLLYDKNWMTLFSGMEDQSDCRKLIHQKA
jgi:hypothetical protein